MRFVACLLLILLLSACGHKGPVQPLGEHLPVAPRNLALLQRGETFLISFDLPTQNQDGSRVEPLQGIEVLRMDFSSGSICATCRDDSRPIAEVDLEYLQGAQRNGERISLVDDAIEPGYAYRYHVVALTAEGRRGIRSTIDAIAVTPPPPPTGLAGEGLDRLVRLSWSPVQLAEEAGTLTGYALYRRTAEERFPFTPLPGTPVTETHFEDLGVGNDISLHYTVRTILKIGDREVQSARSEELVVTPRAGR